jgi:hypothetical protein
MVCLQDFVNYLSLNATSQYNYKMNRNETNLNANKSAQQLITSTAAALGSSACGSRHIRRCIGFALLANINSWNNGAPASSRQARTLTRR